MINNYITDDLIDNFKKYLFQQEKSNLTIQKYLRDVNTFKKYSKDLPITKETVISYKQYLIDKGYSTLSINSMLASINSLFTYLKLNDLRVKSIKVQRQIFCKEEKELSKEEYKRLCKIAKQNKNYRLNLIIQTICATGIRVSELKYITVDALRKSEVLVNCKGKIRSIFIIPELKKKLLRYINNQSINKGSIFITKKGNPISRTNIWKEMKALCNKANVNPHKVFPHNLRHLFARVFYAIEKDIAKLADILGHSSINTTRIYIVSTGIEHKTCMKNMKLII